MSSTRAPDPHATDHYASDHYASDHYVTLGVADSAAHATIQAAYRRVMRATHPDVAGEDPTATARAVAANTAWAVLRNPTARALYDRERARAAPPAVPVPLAQTTVGPRPVTIQQLREAADRHSAFSDLGRQQRLGFSAASLRIGVMVVLIGAVLLALVAGR